MTDLDYYADLLKQKDTKAFEYIYQQTKYSVFAIIIAIVKDKNLAEDVMQDTYIKTLSYINFYDKSKSFKNWILTIARNAAIDSYRKRKNYVLIDTNEQEFMLPTKNDTNYERLLAKQILKLLNDDEREIVMLHLVSDLKFKDVAEVLNKPLGTVITTYTRAINRIKKMKEYNVNE